MPGNTIEINRHSQFYVGDSKMPSLIKWLKKNAHAENKKAKKLLKEVVKNE